MQEDRTLLKVDDVAALMRLPRASVYDLVRSDSLPVVRIGRLLRFDPERLAQFIRSGGAARHVDEQVG